MGENKDWHPDKDFLKKLEKYWIRAGFDLDTFIDTGSLNLTEMHVSKVVDMFDPLEMPPEIQYLRSRFDLDSRVSQGAITLRESLNQMMGGDTALGVINYVVVYYGGWRTFPGFIEEDSD